MSLSDRNRQKVDDYLTLCREKLWPERWRRIAADSSELSQKLDNAFRLCEESEQKYLAFVLGSLPLSDLSQYDPALFLHTVREALAARKEFPWYGQEGYGSDGLPEHLFVLDVLYPRVFDEELSDCRALFRRELGPRVKGLTLEDAVLEVNRWCAEHVTYRSTDDYTDSALHVFFQGYGRCGEESVFAVNALRSVGIAARQVYAPWWSHCDDNHGWVEVWDGRRWRYLGACEPEPELDRGWFTSAAARAMLIHSHAFVAGTPREWRSLFPSVLQPESRLGEEYGLVCEALPGSYSLGRECPVFVTVLDGFGKPAADARVTFQVFNMADFRTIAVRKTGQDGMASLIVGNGSFFVLAEKDGLFAGKLIPFAGELENGKVELTLSSGEGAVPVTACDFDFHAPADCAEAISQPLTAERKRARREVLERCAARRKGWENAVGSRTVPERRGGALPLAGREALSFEGDCTLCLTTPKEQAALWNQSFSLSRLDRGQYRSVALSDLPAGTEKSFSLTPGWYRLITTVRLPNGDQLARVWKFLLEQDRPMRLSLSFRQADPSDLLKDLPLPPFSFTDRSGIEISGSQLLAEAPFSLLCFLEPGREPTEHILNELLGSSAAFRETGAALHFVLNDMSEERDPTFRKALSKLSGAKVWQGEFEDLIPLLARRVYGDPDKLPLVLLSNCKGDCLYSCCGYNVGTANLIVQLLRELTKSDK